MLIRARRKIAAITVLAASGILVSGPGTSCGSFVAESGLVTADLCFIFDCQNGILGGTIDPCSGIGSGDQTIEGQSQQSLFTDCATNQSP